MPAQKRKRRERTTVPSSVVAGLKWKPENPDASGLIFRAAAATHPGLVRTVNEDSWLACPPIFAVADGMGGHDAGDVASRLVIEAFSKLEGREKVTIKDLDACIEECRFKISELYTDTDHSPGSTVVAAAYVIEGGAEYWLLVNIGDSRAYLWSPSGLEQLSHDHSLVQEMVDAGEINAEEARYHPERHVITRAIGALENSPPDYSLVPIERGSRLVLCSDGMPSELSEHAIGLIMGNGLSAEETVSSLVGASVSAGGHDNVTVVVVDVLAQDASDINEDTLGKPLTLEVEADTLRVKRAGR